MSNLSVRLRAIERRMHLVWTHHCAGVPLCNHVAHKPIWTELQQCLLEAATELEKGDTHG